MITSLPFLSPGTRVSSVPQRVPQIKVSNASGQTVLVPLAENLPDGHSIIAILQSLVDQFGREPYVRQVAISLLTSLGNNDNVAHVKALTEWVKSHVIYTSDPDGGELFISPLILLGDIARQGFTRGDCDDHVMLLGSLLVSVGIPVRVEGVKLFADDHYDHVVLSAMVNGRWVQIDPCAKNGWQPVYRDVIVAKA